MVLTAQTLTGTLTDPDGAGEGVSIASDAVITATVDLLPLGTEDTTVTITADAEALKVKEGEVKTAEEVLIHSAPVTGIEIYIIACRIFADVVFCRQIHYGVAMRIL